MSCLWIPVTNQRANPTLRPFLLHGQCFPVFILIAGNVLAELCRICEGPMLFREWSVATGCSSGLYRRSTANPDPLRTYCCGRHEAHRGDGRLRALFPTFDEKF